MLATPRWCRCGCRCSCPETLTTSKSCTSASFARNDSGLGTVAEENCADLPRRLDEHAGMRFAAVASASHGVKPPQSGLPALSAQFSQRLDWHAHYPACHVSIQSESSRAMRYSLSPRPSLYVPLWATPAICMCCQSYSPRLVCLGPRATARFSE